MAAPKDSPEQAFRLRQFKGTNTEIDSTFLGPSFVARSENWIPTQAFRLGKRPGSVVVQAIPGATATALLAAHDKTGALYLYAYGLTTNTSGEPTGGAKVYQSVGEAAFTADPPLANFPDASSPIGRMIQFRDRIYAGNGKDPLVSWVIGAPSSQTITFSGITDTGPPPGATAPTAPAGADTVPAGTYTYAWAVFDTTPGKGVYVSRSDPGTITVPSQATLSFTRPAAATLPLVNRLFVSPRNFPIEYATMQATGTTTTPLPDPVLLATVDVTDTRVPMAGGINVFRTGNMFLVWTNRLIFAGSQADPYSVFATDVILPGLEQSAYNQGTLFPDFAKVPLPEIVTGIGIAGVTAEFDATAPLLFFTASRTFLVQGDPFDPEGEAQMIEVSSRVGCISHDTIVNTPVGTIFCGIDSVYLIPPGGGYPQDIGWPIANQIRQIPTGARASAMACFHKQFYKLAIPTSGGSGAINSWWCDLRGGVGQVPSWWGPMTMQDEVDAYRSPTACTADPNSPYEVDRGYLAFEDGSGNAQILRTHQLATYSDPNFTTPKQPIPVRSILQSGRFDADQPFDVKVFTRVRLICQTSAKSALRCNFIMDGGARAVLDPILIGQDMEDPGQFVHLTAGASGTPPPPNKCWNTAHFGSIAPVEVQTITPYTRPRALSIIVNLRHDPSLDRSDTDPTTFFSVANVELRDFELLFIFSERKVRYIAGTTFKAERISS